LSAVVGMLQLRFPSDGPETAPNRPASACSDPLDANYRQVGR
jgi:hypothetical protein